MQSDNSSDASRKYAERACLITSAGPDGTTIYTEGFECIRAKGSCSKEIPCKAIASGILKKYFTNDEIANFQNIDLSKKKEFIELMSK